MAKRIIRTGLLGAIIFFIFSCENKDCFSTSGVKGTEYRTLEAFKNIEIYSYFNVYLKSDTLNAIKIEAGEKQIQNIETEVVGGVLTIKDKNACGFIKGYSDKNLYISVDTLNDLVVYDGINLYSTDTIKGDEVRVFFNSDIGYCDLTLSVNTIRFIVPEASGDFILKGNAGYLYSFLNGLSSINAEGLDAQTCYAYSSSMGDSYVRTSGLLTVIIKDEGNIFYSGVPSEIDIKEKTGSGNLIKKD